MAAKCDISLTAAKVLKRIPPLAPAALRYNEWRHDRINRELAPFFAYAWAEARDDDAFERAAVNDGPIWIFWWQGLESAPDCVRACVNSIRAHAGDRKVVLITSANIREYARLSERVYDLAQSGVITLTHLSDLLRYSLLRHHGGLWMDASMYTTRTISDVSDRTIFTCGGYLEKVRFNVSSGRWLGGLVGGPAGNPMFCFMDEFFKRYWELSDKQLDYFLIDYAVNYAWERNIGGFATDCREAKGRQPKLFELRAFLDKPFSRNTWEKLADDTSVFMISHKCVHDIRPGSFSDVLLGKYLHGDC